MKRSQFQNFSSYRYIFPKWRPARSQNTTLFPTTQSYQFAASVSKVRTGSLVDLSEIIRINLNSNFHFLRDGRVHFDGFDHSVQPYLSQLVSRPMGRCNLSSLSIHPDSRVGSRAKMLWVQLTWWFMVKSLILKILMANKILALSDFNYFQDLPNMRLRWVWKVHRRTFSCSLFR